MLWYCLTKYFIACKHVILDIFKGYADAKRVTFVKWSYIKGELDSHGPTLFTESKTATGG